MARRKKTFTKSKIQRPIGINFRSILLMNCDKYYITAADRMCYAANSKEYYKRGIDDLSPEFPQEMIKGDIRFQIDNLIEITRYDWIDIWEQFPPTPIVIDFEAFAEEREKQIEARRNEQKNG